MFRVRVSALILLLSFKSLAADEVYAVHKLSEVDVLAAKAELLKTAQQHQILRHAMMVGAASLVGFTIYKSFSKGAQPTVIRAKAIMAENVVSAVQSLEQRVFTVEKALKVSHTWTQWFKDIFSATGMSLLPMVGMAVLEKTKAVFRRPNVWQFATYQLGMPTHFKRLKTAQIDWQPKAFLENVHHKEDREMRMYAQERLEFLATMPASKVAALKVEAQQLFVDECNVLIKQVVYVIAYMRYMIEHDQRTRNILDTRAEQLFLSSYEFACKIEALMSENNIAELFNAVALFQSNFGVALNSFLIFTK